MSAEHAIQRELHDTAMSSGGGPHSGICACGKSFRSKQRDQRYCSVTCAAAYRERPEWEYYHEYISDDPGETGESDSGESAPTVRLRRASKHWAPILRNLGLPPTLWDAARQLGMSTGTLRNRLRVHPDRMPMPPRMYVRKLRSSG